MEAEAAAETAATVTTINENSLKTMKTVENGTESGR
jgi:hypothetical protein